MIPDAVRNGFGGLPVGEAHRQQALSNLEAWWDKPRYAAFRPQLESLVRHDSWELLFDSFYRVMSFGTGGRRGPVGIGPNRINQDTVISSVQGHVNFLRRRLGSIPLRIVVAFDVRVFRDLRGLYDTSVANPLLGVRSLDFARLACAVYAANDAEVYTVPGDDGFFLSTPELSFAIRHLQAHGGLNISASHNHPDDNGAKFYRASGGQPVAPEDEQLAGEVAAVEEFPEADFDAAQRSGRVKRWDADLHARYLEENLSRSIDPEARRATIVYSPLHGTGRHTVGDLLPRAGFDVRFVEEQLQADGSFAAVKFRIANPEVPQSMDQVMQKAREVDADAGFATDPDADRLGVVAPSPQGWRHLTGNEIAILLAAYIIEARRERGTLPKNAYLIKTAVTTELLTRIAEANEVQMLGDLLVGFKYVGEALDGLESEGRFRHLRGTPDDFLLAAEESNGVLVSPKLRDKDAAGGALLLAELGARLRARNSSLGAYLTDVYRRYGYPANLGYSLIMEGISGLELVRKMMERLRAAAPQEANGKKLKRAVDFWDETAFGKIKSETDRSSRNFVQMEFDGGLFVSVRPSGTEPKIKIYVERVFDPQEAWDGDGFAAARLEMDMAVQETTLAVVDQLLRSVDIELPRPGLLVSALVSLDNRLDFANRFLPELDERLPDGDAAQLAPWIDKRLAAYGPDPRLLVAAGIRDHAAARKLPQERKALLSELFPE
jgi:phosphoglucomutase/phosphomannomutase